MNLVNLLNGLKAVYVICPCCGEAVRLADAMLFTRKPPPLTPFERLNHAEAMLDGRIEEFEETRYQVEERSRGRGREAARRRLREIVPFFSSRNITPKDVRVVFDPVAYVVFTGLDAGKCGSVMLIDHPPLTPVRERIQRSIERAISAGNVEWQTLRISQDGRVHTEH